MMIVLLEYINHFQPLMLAKLSNPYLATPKLCWDFQHKPIHKSLLYKVLQLSRFPIVKDKCS